jgi:ATP-dependent Clp protease ATP-binding subunit ClpA
MTSNLGSEHFRKLTSPLGFRSRGIGIEQVQGDIRRELERRVPPEFLNRIDEVVLFAPLTHDETREIAKHYLEQVRLMLDRWGKTIEIEDDALELIVAQGYSLAYGARFLKRVIDERIKLPMSARWREGSHFHVRVRGADVAIEAAPGVLLGAGQA